MALIECTECGKEVSSRANACPNCGNPIRGQSSSAQEGTLCSKCKTRVAPVVTSVGGGSCSFGKRETWKCPRCKKVLHQSGCFVATVTYGDEDLIEVRFLRAFRDEVLSESLAGRILIWVYYRVGSQMARVVELLPLLKTPCRWALDQVVAGIEASTHLRRSSFRDPKP